MTANDFQVGGNHYDSSYKHWDFVVRTGMGYLDGVATKYLARWEKKGAPRMDLEKADHYTQKLIEEIHVVILRPRPPMSYLDAEVTRFCEANSLRDETAAAVRLLTMWQGLPQLNGARGMIERLIARLPEEEREPPTPVPLEDSNKHAPRAGEE